MNSTDCVLLIGNPLINVNQLVEKRTSITSQLNAPSQLTFEQHDRLHQLHLPPSAFHHILSGMLDPPVDAHTRTELAQLFNSLTPNGRLEWITATSDTAQIQSDLQLVGFVNASITPQPGRVHVVAYKPEWAGAQTRLSLQGTGKATRKWKKKGKMESFGDLIDEDTLLTREEASSRPELGTSDCSTKRKACKNCSCGRAEMEAQDTVTLDHVVPVASSCGNCALGDAFRCGSCPYLGMPAFQPGQTVMLQGNLLEDDF